MAVAGPGAHNGPSVDGGRPLTSPFVSDGAGLRFLPPYSPDLTPIELAFATLTAFLRTTRPRRFDQAVELVGIALGLDTPQECLNIVRHCGYRVSTTL